MVAKCVYCEDEVYEDYPVCGDCLDYDQFEMMYDFYGWGEYPDAVRQKEKLQEKLRRKRNAKSNGT